MQTSCSDVCGMDLVPKYPLVAVQVTLSSGESCSPDRASSISRCPDCRLGWVLCTCRSVIRSLSFSDFTVPSNLPPQIYHTIIGRWNTKETYTYMPLALNDWTYFCTDTFKGEGVHQHFESKKTHLILWKLESGILEPMRFKVLLLTWRRTHFMTQHSASKTWSSV